MKRFVIISTCLTVAVIIIIGLILFVFPETEEKTPPPAEASVSVPDYISVEEGKQQDMFTPVVKCSQNYTLSFSIKDEKIAKLNDNKIQGLKIGETLIKTTLTWSDGTTTEYTNLTVYERTQDLNIFVSDEYGKVDKIYYSNSSLYYLTILDEQVGNAKLEYSNNAKNITKISQEEKKIVYSFNVTEGEDISFTVTNNSETKTLTLECEEINNDEEKAYFYVLSFPSAFKSEYSINGNEITIHSAQFIPLSFKIVNALGEEYPNTYASTFTYSSAINCEITMENNSITILSSQKGKISLTLTSKDNSYISTTFNIILI